MADRAVRAAVVELSAAAFAGRSIRAARVAARRRSEISRFRACSLSTCVRLLDYDGLDRNSRRRSPPFYRSSIPRPSMSLSTLHLVSRGIRRKTRGQDGSLAFLSWGSLSRRLCSLMVAASFRAGPDDSAAAAYASFTTITVISAVTSLCSFTGTLYSPSCLMGSSNWILRRSTAVKSLAARASATSLEVTEPNN